MCLVKMSAHPAQLFKIPSHPKSFFLAPRLPASPFTEKKENQFERPKEREEKEEVSVGLS